MTDSRMPERPIDAWWSDEDEEWVHGNKDEEGRLIGLVRYWNKAGVFISDCEHREGKPHGRARRVYSDGSIEQDCQYVNGIIDGARRICRPESEDVDALPAFESVGDGVLFYECYYEDGDIIGMASFDVDGKKIQSNGQPMPERPPGVPLTVSPLQGGWLFMRRKGEDGTEVLEIHDGRDFDVEEALLLRLRGEPENNALRLEFADLIAGAEPDHAALIRLDCDGGNVDERAPLIERIKSTLPEAIAGETKHIKDGFFESKTFYDLSGEDFLEHHEALFRWSPFIKCLDLNFASYVIPRLAVLPSLSRYTSLNFWDALLFQGRAPMKFCQYDHGYDYADGMSQIEDLACGEKWVDGLTVGSH